MVNNNKVIDSINNFIPNKIWLRVNASYKGFVASFAYSLDGEKFIPFGNKLEMGIGYRWTANRFALFNFSTLEEGGMQILTGSDLKEEILYPLNNK